MNATKKAQDTDVCLPQPLPDSISSIALNGDTTSFSNVLVATSWDNTVRRIFETSKQHLNLFSSYL